MLIAAYALGALDGDHLACVEEHLPTCRDCRFELDSYEHVVGTLAASVEPVAPPAHLRSRILGAVKQQRRAADPSVRRRAHARPGLAATAGSSCRRSRRTP